jgi:hypothetical protein
MEALLRAFQRTTDSPWHEGGELFRSRMAPEVVRLIQRANSSIEPVIKLNLSTALPAQLDWTTVPKSVRDQYATYEALPRTMSEWESRGRPAGGWNGDAIYLQATRLAREGEAWTIDLDLRQAPYKLLNAEIDARTAGTNDPEWGARQLHVGVLAVVQTPEGPAAIGQIRGPWVERPNTVHPLLIAGGVSPRNFADGRDPIRSALQQERLQELKQTSSAWEISKPLYILHEGGRISVEGGPPGTALYCNVTHVLRGVDGEALTLDSMVQQFREYSERLAARGIDPSRAEVGGWVVIPLHGGAFANNDGGELVLRDVTCYRPTAQGGVSITRESELPLFSAAVCHPFLELARPGSALRERVQKESGNRVQDEDLRNEVRRPRKPESDFEDTTWKYLDPRDWR